MSINCTDLLALAENQKSDIREIMQRSAASNAYYYCHHAGKNYLKSNHATFSVVAFPSHAKVIECLSDVDKPLSYILRDLRRLRESADYDLHIDFKKETCDRVVSSARRFKERIDNKVAS